MKKINLFFVFTILISCIAGYALLHVGLPPTHDGEYHILRFYQFDKTLRSGDIYPRWAPDFNNGYGVPLFNYVYPLPNYVASFLHIFGVSFIDAFKLNMFIALICGAIFFYLWAKIFWGDKGGMVSSIVYTYAPYHFLDIYIRGSVGEVWALAFFPAFLWSITNFIKKKNWLFAVSSSLFLALIIFSHNILALMFFPFALSYICFLISKEKNKKYLLLKSLFIVFLGLGLSAIFWLPALMEKQYVTGLQIYNIAANFPELYQLLIPSWGSGFSGQSLGGQMSFQIGVSNLLVVLASIGLLIKLYKNNNIDAIKLVLFFLFWFCLLFFLMIEPSLFFWNHIPFMYYFQFPWRFLSLVILVTSFLAGAIFSVWRSNILAICFVLLVVLLTIGYAKPAYYHDRTDKYYLTRPNFIDGTNSPGDLFNTIWFNKRLKKQKDKIVIKNGTIISSKIEPTKYTFDVRADLDTQITVNTAYFVGWRAIINKKEVDVKADSNGLITLDVPKGNYTVELQLKNTLVRTIGNSIFLLSLFSIFLYFFYTIVVIF